ncbi:hypothetical protein M3Y94_00745000 [Aphelenchoides besseyi]|nr:hypothetical protein M3Y94_00745000 [Aphelenchoides besseyi]
MDELNCAICVVGEWRSDWISIDGRPVECSLRLKHTSKPDSYGGKYKLCLDVKVHELSQPAFYMYYVMWAETLDGRRKSVKRSYVNRFPKTFDDPISSYHFTDQLDKQLLDEFEQKESIVFRAYVKIINELPVHSDDSNIINETTHVQHLNGRTWIQCPVKKFSEMYNNSEKGEFWFSELFSIAGHGHDARACLCIIPVKDRGLSVYLSVVDVVNDAEVYLHSQSWIKKMNRTFESSVTKVKHKYKSRSSKLIAFLSKSDVDHLLQDDSDIVIHCKITRKNALLPMPMNFVPRPTTLSWNLENFRSVLNTPDLYFSPFFLITGYEHLEGCLIFQRFSEPNEDGDQSRLSLIVERKNLCNASGTFHVQLCAKTLDGTSIRKNMTVYTPSTSRLVESLFKPHQFDEQELIRIAREEDEITFECIIEPINLIKTRGEADLIAVLTGNGADTW